MTADTLRRLFTDHPRSVGGSYPEHARQATRFGLRLLGSGLACLVHALIPALCRTTGSDSIERLHREMVSLRRDRNPPPTAAESSERARSLRASGDPSG